MIFSEEILFQILQGSSIPSLVIDKTHTIVHWNLACENSTGFSAQEMIGTRNQWMPFYPEQRPIMADLILDNASEEIIEQLYGDKWRKSAFLPGAYEAEDFFPIVGDTGKGYFFTAAPIKDVNGQIVGAVETLQDTTQRQLAEKELLVYRDHLEMLVAQRTADLTISNDLLLKEVSDHIKSRTALDQAHCELENVAEGLKEANEELSQYAYVVSHDLRAPLRAIKNYMDFITEDIGEIQNAEIQSYFDGITRALQQGEALVNDLLEFSQVGRATPVMEKIDVGALLRSITAPYLQSEDVEIVMADTWPVISTCKMFLLQIFQNLITNAIKFNNSSSKKVELAWHETETDGYEFSVRDNGIGIDAGFHDKIFKMFHRLHTSTEFEGTGIGLAIVKKAATKLRGSVRVESTPGMGTTFFVRLPLITRGDDAL